MQVIDNNGFFLVSEKKNRKTEKEREETNVKIIHFNHVGSKLGFQRNSIRLRGVRNKH